jgi:hypothetical protein
LIYFKEHEIYVDIFRDQIFVEIQIRHDIRVYGDGGPGQALETVENYIHRMSGEAGNIPETGTAAQSGDEAAVIDPLFHVIIDGEGGVTEGFSAFPAAETGHTEIDFAAVAAMDVIPVGDQLAFIKVDAAGIGAMGKKWIH